MNKNYFAKCVLAFALLMGAGLNAQVTTTFDYTGDVQTYVVPPGITSVEIEVWGAQGQATTVDDYAPFSTGGLGGYAIGTLSVTPGETLNIYVGGQGTDGSGGYNGGATGGSATPGSGGTAGNGGSGGGASDVRQGGTALTDRVIVGGGGGGGGRNYTNGSCVPCGTGGDGGDGGGTSGLDGDDPADAIYGIYFNVGSGAGGGTDVAGGAAGDGTEGPDGNMGALGIGGIGVNGAYGIASGGGGGGYYGGGSGAGANSGSGAAGGGGGGGSSYVGGVTDGSTTPGLRSGNGQIIITELCIAMITEVSETEICEGEELTLSAESTLGGEITWDDPEVTNGEPFIPSGSGVITYTAESDMDGDCPFEVEITIHEAPEVTADASATDICEGDELTVTAGGTADEYVWNNDAEDGVAYVPALGTGTFEYTVVGTETTFGCQDSATVEVTIHENPTVVATADQEIYCEGDEITLTGSGAATYEWSDGVEDGVAFTQDEGSVWYTVVGTSDAGCEGTDSIEVTVAPNPEITLTATDELYGDDGSITLTIDVGLAPYTFDWDNDGTGDFDDDQNLTDIPGGTYTVVITDANGCSTTATITVESQLSIDELLNSGIVVFPNPTAGELNITQSGAYMYNLTTLSGEIVLNGTGTDNELLDLSNMANGIYLLNITADGVTKTVKIVKQ